MSGLNDIGRMSGVFAVELMTSYIVPVRDTIGQKHGPSVASTVALHGVTIALASMLAMIAKNVGNVPKEIAIADMIDDLRTDLYEKGVKFIFEKYGMPYIPIEKEDA